MNILYKVITKSGAIRNKRLVEAIPKSFVFNTISGKNFFNKNSLNSNLNFLQQEKFFMSSINKVSKFHMSSKLPSHRKLFMPNLSPTMTKGNILDWTKKEGDIIKPGDSIASVETDKAVVDFEVNEEGYLAKILCPAGSKDINLGTLVAILVEEKNDIAAFANYKDGGSEPEAPSQNKKTAQPEATAQQPNATTISQSSDGRVIASPLARKTAKENVIDLSGIQGTGPNGRIINADVLETKSAQKARLQVKTPTVAQSQPAQPQVSASAQFEDIELSNVRKVIAERLLFSKTNIPHFYLGVECNVDKLLGLRSQLNKHSPVKISINDMIIKAASLACIKVPEANSSWQGNFIRKYKNVDMSVAVQTDYGLITPIVVNSNLKGLAEISRDVKDLAERAKQQKLKPQEFQGGTFTISNLGMMGISNFSAIINPPQSCILAVGKSEKRVVFDELSKDKEAPYKVVNMMSATLSCDHRVVDGAVGAKWVQEFTSLIENPELMLL